MKHPRRLWSLSVSVLHGELGLILLQITLILGALKTWEDDLHGWPACSCLQEAAYLHYVLSILLGSLHTSF